MAATQATIRGHTALVTGASSGIGYELSAILAAEGCHLVLVARNREKLQQVAQSLKAQHGVKAMVVAKD